jgi:enterochelin esterase-like enzyme
MNKFLILTSIFFSIYFQIKSQNSLPKTTYGKIERIQNFPSKYVTARNIDVWLPEEYSEKNNYAVLYMHDGQMLYDSSQTWNKQSWDIDDVAYDLISKNKTRDFVIVGIWNGGETRHQDYFPQKPFEQLSIAERDSVVAQLQRAGRVKDVFRPLSDNYLKFIVSELKPYIDQKYSVFKNRENTFIGGSSMGGLISLYGICEYPKIFGGAACLSTHWVGTFTTENNAVPNALINYLTNHLPNPKNHKIYFDCGDQTLDVLYPAIQQKVDRIMTKKGFNSKSWVTKYFPGQNHSEKAWNRRVAIPLEFLLK